MMNIDFSKLPPEKRSQAEKIYRELNDFEAAHVSSTRTSDPASERKRITESIEKLLGASLEQQVEISRQSNGVWLLTAYRVLSEIADPFKCENKADADFFDLISTIRRASSETLFKAHWQLKEKSEPTYKQFVEYFAKYPLWGSLDPDRHDFDTIKRRANVLKQHSYDFVWLYRRLSE